MGKSAIVLGATGVTGKLLLELLLKDNRYHEIKIITRRATGITHPKVFEYVADMLQLQDSAGVFSADDIFCCIGTTKAKTPDKGIYYKTDHGIPVTAAKLARQNGCRSFIVISALGADIASNLFYNRTKGEMERDVLEQGIAKTHILRPSLIEADRNEARPAERLGILLMRIINPLLVGRVARYKSIKAGAIAKAMLWLANNDYESAIVPSEDIKKLALL
ncbi:nucleoside-diphosphate sugar epimerase [Flavobacterium cyanobacteriorum]|uniref:Nucleoside-diphosphate sugar epimerase n=1 Tax=Flavobacterium cyanobacteriorum TaxID=2022802 RepID=A0A255YZR7_9FLAO|nr:NAD(P)H-binding protein [Flavobacterium cyanobacteriorum]OYQ34737.1 nucleoside-diphosphate sugar epimerase [Flavobacterium cyanobacteriorum]